MQTTIQKVNDVEFDLEIKATAEDLSGDLSKAIQQQRGRTTMKGFRPGRVPLSLVKKMYGKALAYGVAEDVVQKTYESTVMKAEDYDVLGQPTITDLEYEFEGDLRAVVRFGVRPEIKLKKLGRQKLLRLAHEVSDADVQSEIDNMLSSHAEFIPEDTPASAESFVIVDMQRLDLQSGEPVEGEKQTDVEILLSEENILSQLRDAVVGLRAGERATAEFPSHEEGGEARRYEIDLKEVKRRELPELTEELITEITGGKIADESQLLTEVRSQLEDGWEKRSRDFFESAVIERMVKLHKVPVSSSVVDMYLDAFLKDATQQSGGELPPHFDEAAFRESRTDEATRQAAWMFIRDQIVTDHDLEVTEEDIDAYLEKTTRGSDLPLDTMKEYYRSVPNMMDQLNQRLLTEKVFDWISEQVKIEVKNLEAFQKAMKAEEGSK